LYEVVFIVIAAFIGGFIARALRFPPVVGYIVSGIVFGAIGKSLITSYESLFHLSEIGVTLLLFTLGFEISLDIIRKISKKILLAGVLQIIITALVLVPLLMVFNFGIQVSVFFSLLFAFSSTAVIVKMLEEKGMLHSFPGSTVFIFLLIQDIFIIPVILLMPLIFGDFSLDFSSIGGFFISGIKPLLVFAGLFALSKLLLSKMLAVLFQYPSQELTLLATIFTAATSMGLLIWAGVPATIAAFFSGVLISDQGKNLAPLSSIRPLRDLFLVTFFVLMGMLIDVAFVIQNLGLIVPIVLLILLIKFAILFVILAFFRFLPSSNVFISVHMANVGEFAAVIGQIAFIQLFISNDTYKLLLSIFVVSIMLIPFWSKMEKRIFKFLAAKKFLNFIFMGARKVSQPIVSEIKNHVIICGHGRVGREVRNILELSKIPYLVIDLDRRVIEQLVNTGRKAIYGDPSDPEILRSAFTDEAKAIVIAIPNGFAQKTIIKSALKINPKILIIVRAHEESDKYELVNLGVNKIVNPEVEAGILLGRHLLEVFGMDEKKIRELISRVKKYYLIS